ncbi:interleukin-17 receptor E [Lacerta agilis]|uniref:interleukin-17 receptor E n=1 Tax=Lacerta agilis TaxID=80427 RepID=UPI0014195FC3|nr:interleukin-17 receptor E [Lacerta agilis]
MGRTTLSALLLLPTAFLLSLLHAAPRNHLPPTRPQLLTNFECWNATVYGALPRSKFRCQRKLQEDLSLRVPSLSLSPVQLFRKGQTCVRVRLALNATGIEGLELHFLVISSKRSGWLQIFRGANAGTLWQVLFDCFPAESGRRVLVSLETIPGGVLSMNESLFIPHNQLEVPEFHHRWVPAARAIEVSVTEGPDITVRLCHQLALECEELRQPFHQQVLVSKHHPALLTYELLLPCLCIEASYHEHHDSLRKKACPFWDQPEAYGPDLWSSVIFRNYSNSGKAEMAMSLSGRCLLHPTASLCWKESAAPGAACQDIPNSTVTGLRQEYIFKEVDVHPRLCFKFSYGNSVHIKCPLQTDTAWNVSMSVKPWQLHLHFHSRVPASFSSALCQKQSPRQCEPEPPVYTITHLEGSSLGDLDLILPWRTLTSCVLVWRSDVRFAGKQLLCPDVTHRHWGLLAFGVSLGLVLLLVAVVLLIRCVLRRLHRDVPGKSHSRPILLIYSPDSEEHKQLVCAFAALLRSALGCPVLLDLWELGHVGRLGILPWVYAQREQVSREQGQVLLLWSVGSARAYGLWQGKAARCGGAKAPEPHDLFGAAMACLKGELQGGTGAVRGKGDWVIAYFSKLCGRRNIPRALHFLPRYRLPQELPGLVRVLQGPSSSAPRWLRASAKALVCRLLKAERKKAPQSQRHQPWRSATEKFASSLVPFAPHPKLRRPSCA